MWKNWENGSEFTSPGGSAAAVPACDKATVDACGKAAAAEIAYSEISSNY
jgi:hypothetical protein